MTMDYNYIFLTYDALLEFASGRTFQSAEFSQSEHLLKTNLSALILQKFNLFVNVHYCLYRRRRL